MNSSRQLMCYKTKAASPVTVPANVFTNNQFGPGTVVRSKEDELCIPSTKLP